MKREAPVKKNQDIEIEIDALASEGQGIGRIEGYTVFVPYALPKERVMAHIIKVNTGYAIAKLTEVLSPSPDRVKPRCPAFFACGGCNLQHMSYEKQLEFKRQTVFDALTRIGGLSDIEVEPTLGMEEPWRYRNKGSFPTGTVGGETVVGFFAPRSHRLVPIFDCPISDSRVTDTAQKVAEWANENKIQVYDEETGKGALRHIVVRATQEGGIMAVIVTAGKLPRIERLIEKLDGIVDSLYHNNNPDKTNVIFGSDFHPIYGASVLTEKICGNRILVSPRSFLQVNSAQCERLYEIVMELLKPGRNESVADIYCGVGTMSLMIANEAKRVIGIENVAEAITDAKRNAALNGLSNLEFICGDAETVLPKRVADGLKLNAAVLDPPRKGCEERVLKAVVNSGVKRIVYVSCNPATLARDLKYLTEQGLHPTSIHPVDMFPHTSHVETIVGLQRETL
ncbi:MAG: 23S rRNA (uracil(1939)-C(5))-methyltransferase RlmD [Clostridia bacterium]|nr:23S rRNA (uracil(1939)-C(5))-methyltransferase RlmD [Clostridia bacterium]